MSWALKTSQKKFKKPDPNMSLLGFSTSDQFDHPLMGCLLSAVVAQIFQQFRVFLSQEIVGRMRKFHSATVPHDPGSLLIGCLAVPCGLPHLECNSPALAWACALLGTQGILPDLQERLFIRVQGRSASPAQLPQNNTQVFQNVSVQKTETCP